MLISVITVSYNASSRIERTIRSVIRQDYCDFEYIVIDGGSNDGTVEIIKRYAKNISFWISEPDTGIYNAMNKGVQNAGGRYCIFMNAGDMFYSSEVLSAVSGYLDGHVSIVMGNQVYLTPKGLFATYGRHWDVITPKRLFFDSLYHQACFIKRTDLEEFPYDESLKMVSDWKEALILLMVHKKKYLGIDVDVDFFFQDGLTSMEKDNGANERQMVLNQYFSKEQQGIYRDELVKYKRLFNVTRYFNHLHQVLFQFRKRISVRRPEKLYGCL